MDAFIRYQDEGFEINEALRQGRGQKAYDIEAFSETVVCEEDMALFRGVENAYRYEGFEEGVFGDAAFMSCSLDRDVARSFVCKENKQETCCLLHVHLPAGSVVEMIPIYKAESYHQKEKEVVLMRGTRLEVIRDIEVVEVVKEKWGYQDGARCYEDWFDGGMREFVYPTLMYQGVHVVIVSTKRD